MPVNRRLRPYTARGYPKLIIMLDIGLRVWYGWRMDYGLKLTNDRTALAKRGYREVFNEEEGVGRKTRFLRNEAKSVYVK